MVSSAAAAWRWSLRNSRIRSRASGTICGDSVAATSALTMSSLRRRAIWMQRARSPARSSIGGRASARTAAPASFGSASSRSHASTSRTSARWKNADAPTTSNGTARSSSATVTAGPSSRTERTSTAIRSGRTPSRTRRSTSAATLWACARSFAQRQNSTSPPGAASGIPRPSRSGTEPTTARAAADDLLARAERALERHDRRLRAPRAEVAQVLRRRAAEPRRPSRRRRRPRSAARGRRTTRGPRAAARSKSWYSSTSTWRKRSHSAPCSRSSVERAQEQVAGVERALPRRAARRGRHTAGRTRARARRARPPAARPTRRSRRRRPSRACSGRSARPRRRAATAGLPRKSWRRSVSRSIRSSSSARRSAGVSGTKNGSMPASAGCSRSSRAQRSGTVWTASSPNGGRSASSTCRRRTSAAAAVRVTRRMSSGGTPWSTSHAKRSTSTRVLPVPAPPMTSSGPPSCVTARRCAAVSWSRRGGMRLSYVRVARSPEALEADWLGACRRATQGLREILVAYPTTCERLEETGERGEGGDQTLVIDQKAEDGVFRELEKLHDAGRALPRGLRGARDGRLRLRRRASSSSIPIDGSLNAKRGITARRYLDRGRRPARRCTTSSSASSPTSAPATSGSPGAARA